MHLLSLLFSEPLLFLTVMLAFAVALSVHEASHALAATWLGDLTAKRAGRLTLNPAAHIDLWGFLALITVGFGWGKPVPFNPYNLKYPRLGPVLVAGAGPLSNILLGTLFAFLGRVLIPSAGVDSYLAVFLSYAAYLNFLLCLFNLIPIPPLDGSKALLAALADPRYYRTRVLLETQGPLLLLGLIVLDSFLGVGIFGFLSAGAGGLASLFGGGVI